MKHIVIIEPIGFSNQGTEKLKEVFSGHKVSVFDSRQLSDKELIAKIKSANILILTNRPLSYDVITSIDSLEFIAVAFSGIDHVDSRAVSEKNIIVKNSSGYANTAVAELTIGFMISLARDIPNNHNAMIRGITTNTGSQLSGKTLGIVGYGNIGKQLEALATAFGMKIITYSSKNTQADLESLFRQSDFISLNIPLNDQTKGMIDRRYFNLMKPTAYLINCARGPVINQNDLLDALDKKIIKGAAIDVFEVEPPLRSDHPLLNRSDIITTPHIGFNTNEALVSKAEMAIKNVQDYLNAK